MMTHSAEQFTQQPNAERYAVYPTSSADSKHYSIEKDEAYPLARNMLEDLAMVREVSLKVFTVDALNRALLAEQHVISHLYREVRDGYLAETPLQLSDIPHEDEFTLHVVKEFMSYELERIKKEGAHAALHASYNQDTLFDTVEDVERYVELLPTKPYPLHITETPVEAMTELEQRDWGKFAAIMKTAGAYVVGKLGVSLHSHPTQIIPTTPNTDATSEYELQKTARV